MSPYCKDRFHCLLRDIEKTFRFFQWLCQKVCTFSPTELALSFSDRRRGAVKSWAKEHCKLTIVHCEAEQRTTAAHKPPAVQQSYISNAVQINRPSLKREQRLKEVTRFTRGQFEMFDLTSALRNARNADCMPVLVQWTLVLRCLPLWLQTRAWVTPKQEVPCRCLLHKSFWTATVHQTSKKKHPCGH